jgi:hypothetical protein
MRERCKIGITERRVLTETLGPTGAAPLDPVRPLFYTYEKPAGVGLLPVTCSLGANMAGSSTLRTRSN